MKKLLILLLLISSPCFAADVVIPPSPIFCGSVKKVWNYTGYPVGVVDWVNDGWDTYTTTGAPAPTFTIQSVNGVKFLDVSMASTTLYRYISEMPLDTSRPIRIYTTIKWISQGGANAFAYPIGLQNSGSLTSNARVGSILAGVGTNWAVISNTVVRTLNVPIVLNKWYTVEMSLTGTTMKIYIDGVLAVPDSALAFSDWQGGGWTDPRIGMHFNSNSSDPPQFKMGVIYVVNE